MGLLTAGGLAVGPAAAPHQRGEPGQAEAATVYVSVADAQGRPVRGLTAADFFVQVDETVQTVVTAGPATDPLSVVLLTDRLGVTSDYRPDDLRRALAGFLRVVRHDQPAPNIALTTFDDIVVQAARFGATPEVVDEALDRMTVTGNDAPLVDALADACRTARVFSPTRRRAILLVFAAFRPDRGNPRPDVAGRSCRQSGASIWALEARASDGRNYPNPAREAAVDEVSRSSGGLHELVTTSSRLAGLAEIMAELIAGQYAVTYRPGGGTSDSRLTVGVRREDVIVLAPTWMDR